MEIAPIPGIRALPAVKPRQADFRPPEIFDIKGPAKPGDGSGPRGARRAAGAEENEEDELTMEGEASADGDELEEDADGRIDYFA